MRYLLLLLLNGCAVASTAISSGVYVATDKTITDHVMSYNTGMDCQTVRVFEKQSVCQPYKVRYVERRK
jgi:hypothetical protein